MTHPLGVSKDAPKEKNGPPPFCTPLLLHIEIKSCLGAGAHEAAPEKPADVSDAVPENFAVAPEAGIVAPHPIPTATSKSTPDAQVETETAASCRISPVLGTGTGLLASSPETIPLVR
jgi:hypothetical protein